VQNYCIARQATDDNTIRRSRFLCWINKAIHTPGICNIHCFSTTTMVTRTRPNISLYAHSHVKAENSLSCFPGLRMREALHSLSTWTLNNFVKQSGCICTWIMYLLP
jgi:hypothetical protein